jgi:hypothetical protein
MLDPMMNPIAGGMWPNLYFIVPMLGIAGVVIGSIIVFRRSRYDIESAARWRYRERVLESSHLSALRPRRLRDGLTGRAVARYMIAFAVLLPLVVLFAWVAEPGFSRGMLYEPPWYAAVLPWAGAIGYLVGLGWMVRIYRRSHLEPDTSYWRYRE